MQKIRKSSAWMPRKQASPPMTPTAEPTAKPTLRPNRRISNDAGMEAAAVPITASEIGTVANALSGAMT